MYGNSIEFNYHIDKDNPDNKYKHETTIWFDVSDDMHIGELHRLCRAFALVLGYTESTVDEYFGEERYDD